MNMGMQGIHDQSSNAVQTPFMEWAIINILSEGKTLITNSNQTQHVATGEAREGDTCGGAGGACARLQGWEPDLLAGANEDADAGRHGEDAAAGQGHRHKWSTHDEGLTAWKGGGTRHLRDAEDGRWPRREEASLLEDSRGAATGREKGHGEARGSGLICQKYNSCPQFILSH